MDNIENLYLNSLGTFWTKFFKKDQKDILIRIAKGIKLRLIDAYRLFYEICLALNLKDTPINSKKYYYKLTLTYNPKNPNALIGNYVLYGDNYKYGDKIYYGGIDNTIKFRLKLPSNIKGVAPYLYNYPTDPSAVLEEGKDYEYHSNMLVFYTNIFDNKDLHIETLPDNTQICTLWFPFVYLDRQYLRKKYGIISGFYGDSSKEYKILLETVFAILYDGAKERYILSYLNQVFGLPVIMEDEEVVVKVEADRVVTNFNTYEINEEILADGVKEGVKLTKFTPLSNAIKKRSLKDYYTTDCITIPLKFLDAGYYSVIKVPNRFIIMKHIIGASYDLGIEGKMSDEKRRYLSNHGFTIGMPLSPGGKIGEIESGLSLYDYFIKPLDDNIIIFNVANYKHTPLHSNYLEFLEKILPSNISYILHLQLPELSKDTYQCSIITDDVKVYKGVYLRDTYSTEALIHDGFYGLGYVGNSTEQISDIPKPTRVAQLYMHQTPVIFKRKR